MADYDIFREQLGIRFPSHGHALWDPRPRRTDRPVKVGDVGFVRRGKFHCLFNALSPKSEQAQVPESYEQLVPKSLDHITESSLNAGHYCSIGVEVCPDGDIHRTDPDYSRAEIENPGGRSGAVLSLPVNARREDTLAQSAFGEWIVKHIDHLFAFSRELQLGIERMDEIILVTGCDLTRSWTNVAFLGGQANSKGSYGVKTVERIDNNVHIQYSSGHVTGGVLSHGPQGTNLPENQCVFIRGFRVAQTLRILPKRLKGAAGPSEPEEYDFGSEKELLSIPATTNYRDPLDVLQEYIAERAYDCDLVLIHDDDLKRINEISEGSPLESLQPEAMMDFLRSSNIEIHKVCCEDLSHASSGPSTDSGVVWVAMLSMTYKNWTGVLQSQSLPPEAHWQNHGPHHASDASLPCPPALLDYLPMPPIPGDIYLRDSTSPSGVGSAADLSVLCNIGRSPSGIWSSLNKLAPVENQRLVPTMAIITYCAAELSGWMFPFTWPDISKHLFAVLLASFALLLWFEQKHTRRKFEETNEVTEALQHHIKSNSAMPTPVVDAQNDLPVMTKTTPVAREITRQSPPTSPLNALRDRPLSGASQPGLEEFDFRDSSGPLFSMYLKIGEEEDNRTAERWQGDAKGILYFTGLFSAAVATLLSVTVLDLKPNSQDTSAFHLNNIQQLLTDSNLSRASIPSQPPPFSPPISAIWVNALLFLSLVISLTCALLAILLQRWARRYISFTQQSGYSPHKRARIRAFFADGVDKFHVSWVVEALPALLHLSLSIFLAGLLVWLFNLSGPLFLAVVWWIVLCAIAYICITFLPIFRPNSPYYAPLSPTLWFLYTGIPYAIFKALSFSMFSFSRRFDKSKEYYYERLSDGIGKTAEKTAWKMASEIDVRILGSTLDELGEDDAQAKFFKAIPGFFDPNRVQVKDLEKPFRDFQTKFSRELNGFLDRTFSTSSVPESVKSDQLIICLNASHAVLGSDGVSQILYDILNERWPELLQSVEVADSLRRWNNGTNDNFAPLARRIITQVIVGVRERDDRWISLTKAEFDVPDHVLRDNVGHGDNALSSLLIYVTRQAFSSGSWTPLTLSSLTQFDICNSRPELQHEFCDLWNKIVQEARSSPDSTAINILREIRHAFLTLHQGVDAVQTDFSTRTYHFDPVLADPLSYRVCNTTSHRPDWTPQGPVTNHPVTVTSTRAAFGSSAASTTQTSDSPSPSPRLTPIEIQRIPGKPDIVSISSNPNTVQTAPQKINETSVVLRFPSSTNSTINPPHNTPPHTPAFRSSTPGPVCITQRVHLLLSTGLSSQSSQLALSVGVAADADHMRPEDTMTDPYSSETDETSQVSVAASLPDLYPDSIVGPSADSIPHPFFVPDPDHILDGSQCLTLSETSPRLPEGSQRKEMAVPCAASDTGQILSAANPISRTIPRIGATLQRGEETTVVPTTVVSASDCPSFPIPMLAAGSDPILVELTSFVGHTRYQSGHFPHPLGSSSSSLPTIRSHISLKSPVIDSSVTPSNGIFLAHGDTSEMERLIPMKVFSDSSQSTPPTRHFCEHIATG